MPLQVAYDASGLDGKLRGIIDQIVANIQVWANQVDGINAAERLSQLTSGVASLPTPKPGAIELFAGPVANIPTGYLYCDGTAVSRTTYANLYAAIGTTWGVGDGSTTFNLPDGRGRYFFGMATSGTGSTLGGTFGTKDHTHSGGSISGSTANESAHTHGAGTLANGSPSSFDELASSAYSPGSGNLVPSATHTHSISGSTGSGSSHNHGVGTLAVGTSGTANPPSFVGVYMIKT